MFLSIFGKCISPWFHLVRFIVQIPEVTLKWLWTFLLSIISVSCIWVCMSWVFCQAVSFSSFYWKFKMIFISICNHHFIFKRVWDEFCRNFISYTWISFGFAVINIYCNIAMKSVPVVPRSEFRIKMVASIF